ncbi:MAG: caspase family protein, partial [Planctomycetota bacterium]
MSDKDGDVAIGRYVFAGIGINDYGAPWEPLENAVNDVDSVRAVFVDDFGFESPDEWVLQDADASKAGIEAMIDDLANNLERDDALVFFYAGHGDARDLEFEGEVVGSAGYIVPSSVKSPLTEAPRQY